MKRKAPKEQLPLWDTLNTEPPPAPESTTPAPSTEQHQDEPIISPEWWKSEQLAAWLSQWAQEHHFPRLTFTLFDGKKGYTGIVEPGQENWTHFLATSDSDTLRRARMSADVYRAPSTESRQDVDDDE